jgi:hypothetical protein
MATITLTLRGNQIATYTMFRGDGNGADRAVEVQGVTAIGSASQTFTVFIEQVNTGATQFQNGQFVTIFDSSGAVVMPRAGVNPDAEQGLAGGDAHMLFLSRKFFIDLAGVPVGPETVVLRHADEAGDTGIGDNDGEFDWDDVPAFVCIASGSLIRRATGADIAVEDVSPGDWLACADGQARRVLWVGHGRIDLTRAESALQKPVLLPRGCLGPGRPARDLVLSPQHRVLLQGPEVRALFDTDQVLAPARGLLALPGVRVLQGRRAVIYVSVLLECHAVLLAEGAPVESFYPGAEGMKVLTPALRDALCRVLPGLAGGDVAQAYGPPAARLLRVAEARKLALRLAQAHRRGRLPDVALPMQRRSGARFEAVLHQSP